jgi:hypothetical protein
MPPVNESNRFPGCTLSNAEMVSIARNSIFDMEKPYESMRRLISAKIKYFLFLPLKDALEELSPIIVHYRAFRLLRDFILEKHNVQI